MDTARLERSLHPSAEGQREAESLHTSADSGFLLEPSLNPSLFPFFFSAKAALCEADAVRRFGLVEKLSEAHRPGHVSGRLPAKRFHIGSVGRTRALRSS